VGEKVQIGLLEGWGWEETGKGVKFQTHRKIKIYTSTVQLYLFLGSTQACPCQNPLVG